MNRPFIDSQNFKGIDYTKNKLPKAEYDTCTFIDCNFENSDISNVSFLECEFIDCNFSNVNSMHTILKEVEFINCKLLGVQFQNCNDFILSFNFKACQLDLASFFNLKIKGTVFNHCKLLQVDFTQTDLTNTSFINCNLENTLFEYSNLENVDFRSAYNYTINPEINKLKHAKFSKEGVIGLLRNHKIIVE